MLRLSFLPYFPLFLIGLLLITVKALASSETSGNGSKSSLFYVEWVEKRKTHMKNDLELMELEQKEVEYQVKLLEKQQYKQKEKRNNRPIVSENNQSSTPSSPVSEEEQRKQSLIDQIKQSEEAFEEKDRLLLYNLSDNQISNQMNKLDQMISNNNNDVVFALEPNILVAIDKEDRTNGTYYRLHHIPTEDERVFTVFVKDLSIPLLIGSINRTIYGKQQYRYIASNNLNLTFEELLDFYQTNPISLP